MNLFEPALLKIRTRSSFYHSGTILVRAAKREKILRMKVMVLVIELMFSDTIYTRTPPQRNEEKNEKRLIK